MNPPRVAIIGAGISGLAQADVFQRCGFSVRLFERASQVGGVWARAYPEVSLQNSAPQYHLSSFPWPFPVDLHPTGAQILQYLQRVVVERHLDVQLEQEVVSAREAEGGGWDLKIRGTNGTERQEHFDRLVVSIGQYTEGKNRPEIQGEADFRGTIVTEREVKDLSVFENKRVVVVGFGKSALDMACFAAARKANVTHLFRTPRWAIPRYILGLHMTFFLFNRFGSVMMPAWAHPTAAERALHRVKPVINGFWSGLQALFGFLARQKAKGTGKEGLQRLAAVLPSHSLLPDLRSAAALMPDPYYGLVASGAIQTKQGEIHHLSAEGVHLHDGSVLPADVLVLSLGSRAPVFPFLSPEYRALLESEPDGVQLYRHLIHPKIPTLAFSGYNHGFMHVPAAEIGALWTAAYWRGELVLPPVAEMEQAVEHIRAWKREYINFEPSRSCAVNTRFQQYLDILLLDLGVSPYRKLPNPLAEIFGRYGASDYAGVVEEYLKNPPSFPRKPLPLPT